MLTSEIMQGWTLCFNCINHVVYHAAAYHHVSLMEEPGSSGIYKCNGNKNVADLALRHQVEKFVMVSTDRAVNPTSVMGASKRIAEKYIHSMFYSSQSGGNKTKFITTRLGVCWILIAFVVQLFGKLPMAVQSRLLILKVSVIL
jgi:FlaA1/EpsC-like NDP-sugar epimerase